MINHFKAPKYRLVVINFDDSPAEPIRVLDFTNQLDVGDYIVLPYLTVKPQELIDIGIERLYVTSVGQYCPVASCDQETPRITFTDRLKFSKFTRQLSDENKQLRKLVQSVLVLRHDAMYKWLDAAIEEVSGKSFTEQAYELGIPGELNG